MLTAASAVVALLSSSTATLLVLAVLALPVVVTFVVITLVAALTHNPERHARCGRVLAIVRNAGTIPDTADLRPAPPLTDPGPNATPARPRPWRRRRADSC